MDISIIINTIWVLFGTVLVMFMQAGFAMVETGFTRAKNASNIIMKNFMDFSIGSIIFFFIGFAIMFGSSNFGLIGSYQAFSEFTMESLGIEIPTTVFLMFQTVFAATAATIVSGAMSERTKFSSYIIYSIFITGFVYPVVGHWIWGGGFLSNLGFHDFAGSTVVHSVGGWAALVGATILGPRIGKYNKDGSSNEIPGHSLTLGALGVFILWFGWFGFNGASTLGAMDPEALGHIFLTTNLSAAAGALVTMTISWFKTSKPSVGMTLNGGLAGLVGITAGTDIVSPIGALAIGAIAGLVMYYGSILLDEKFKVDDPVGAVAVHGLSGAAGTILVGIFATEGGLLHGGGISLLLVQSLGVLVVFIWTIATTTMLFKLVDVTVGLRVTPKHEKSGLDTTEHAATTYADFQLNTEAK